MIRRHSVFPKWDSLCKEHVDDLLRFIGDFNTVIHKEKDGKLVNPYLYEIPMRSFAIINLR